MNNKFKNSLIIFCVFIWFYIISCYILDLHFPPGEFFTTAQFFSIIELIILIPLLIFTIFLVTKRYQEKPLLKKQTNTVIGIIATLNILALYIIFAIGINNLTSTFQSKYICSSIITEQGKGYCFFKIALKENNEKICKDIFYQHWQTMCYHNIAIKKTDISICENIKNDYSRIDIGIPPEATKNSCINSIKRIKNYD